MGSGGRGERALSEVCHTTNTASSPRPPHCGGSGKERQGETEVLRPTSRFEITPGLAEAEVISNLEVGKSNFLDRFWKTGILVMFRERKKRRWSMSTLKSKWFCCRGHTKALAPSTQ